MALSVFKASLFAPNSFLFGGFRLGREVNLFLFVLGYPAVSTERGRSGMIYVYLRAVFSGTVCIVCVWLHNNNSYIAIYRGEYRGCLHSSHGQISWTRAWSLDVFQHLSTIRTAHSPVNEWISRFSMLDPHTTHSIVDSSIRMVGRPCFTSWHAMVRNFALGNWSHRRYWYVTDGIVRYVQDYKNLSYGKARILDLKNRRKHKKIKWKSQSTKRQIEKSKTRHI